MDQKKLTPATFNELVASDDPVPVDIPIAQVKHSFPGQDRQFKGNQIYFDLSRNSLFNPGNWFRTVAKNINKIQYKHQILPQIIRRAEGKCENCLENDGKQVYSYWDYNFQTNVKKIVRLACFCVECSRGSTGVPKKNMEFYTKVVEHVKKTFDWTQEQYDLHYKQAQDVRKKRNLVRWKIDISLLTNNKWRLNRKTQKQFTKLFGAQQII